MTSAFVRPEATATITVTTPAIVTPARNVTDYSYGFEGYDATVFPTHTPFTQNFASTVDGWSASNTPGGPVVNRNSTAGRGGAVGYLSVTTFSPDANTAQAERGVTGLIVGRSYTFTAWALASSSATPAPTAYLYSSVAAGGAAVTLNNTTYTQLTHTFTATATSATLYIARGVSVGFASTIRVDDISITSVGYTVVNNNGLNGWSNGSVVSTYKRSGTYSLRASAPARAFTGLVVGHSYTLTAWHSTDGITWTQYVEAFTAAATAQSKTLNVAGTRYWDDVQLTHHVPAVTTLTPVLPISQGKVRLDENRRPYVTANFQVPLTSLSLLEQIDPRTPQRVTVTKTEAVSGVTRTYNLGLRSRTVDHKAGTIDIELASDEILLHDRKRVATTVDSTPRTHEANLRALCTWALGKIGGTLAAGTATADLTAAWDATNLMTNPTAGSNLNGWSNSLGTISRLTTGTFPANTSLASAVRATMNAGADRGPYFNGGDDGTVLGGALNVAIQERQLYRLSMYVRTSVAKTMRLVVVQRNAANATAGRNLHGPNFTTTANTWTRVSYVFQGYPGAVRAGFFPYLPTSTWAAGNTVDVTGVMVTEGTRELDYFDGGTVVRSDLYTYVWNDAAHLSVSERKAHEVRRPELFDWTPGQSLFDFLQPLLNTAGLTLFCDENRVFHLVDPATYEVPGFVVAQTGHNATEGTDEITRNDDTWADAVVVTYTWTDEYGRTQSKTDAAGPENGKTIFREVDREYTGVGAAAAILASLQGRGRTQNVTVVGEYRATPGMDVSVNLPGTLTQIGKVRAVEFDLGSGLTRIETRGLQDAAPGSWVLWNPTQTWAQVNPTLPWKDA